MTSLSTVKKLVGLAIAIGALPAFAHLADDVPRCRPFVRAEACNDWKKGQIVYDVDVATQVLNVFLIQRDEEGNLVRIPVNTGGTIHVSTGRETATFSEELDEAPASCGNTPPTSRVGIFVKYDGDSENPIYTKRDYVSKKFKAEMPYAIRVWDAASRSKQQYVVNEKTGQRELVEKMEPIQYEGKGIFIHGIPKLKENYLGTPASAGCVRVSTYNACRLYETIKTCGGARIRIRGSWSRDRQVYLPNHGDSMKLSPPNQLRPTCEQAVAASKTKHEERIARFRAQGEPQQESVFANFPNPLTAKFWQ